MVQKIIEEKQKVNNSILAQLDKGRVTEVAGKFKERKMDGFGNWKLEIGSHIAGEVW